LDRFQQITLLGKLIFYDNQLSVGTSPVASTAPENPETINRKQLGDLKLTDKQEDLLVAFLKTLTDGYSPLGK